MHSSGFFLNDVAGFLGGYYAFIAIMNGIAASCFVAEEECTLATWAFVWSVFAGVMMIFASLALSAFKINGPCILPDGRLEGL